MTIGRVRGWLYGSARALGDVSAVQHNTVGRRIARRFAGSIAARFLGWIFNR